MTKRKEEPVMISPREYAERAGAKYQTVMLWLRSNLIPGAEKFDLPTGGHYYLVPADAPKPETQRGPKPKKGGAKKQFQTVAGRIGMMDASKKGKKFSVQALPFEPPATTTKPKGKSKKAKKGVAK